MWCVMCARRCLVLDVLGRVNLVHGELVLLLQTVHAAVDDFHRLLWHGVVGVGGHVADRLQHVLKTGNDCQYAY